MITGLLAEIYKPSAYRRRGNEHFTLEIQKISLTTDDGARVFVSQDPVWGHIQIDIQYLSKIDELGREIWKTDKTLISEIRS